MADFFIRIPCLFLLRIFRRIGSLCERASITEIGLTGHISVIDNRIASERKLKLLSRFERWLLKPYIEYEQKRRQEAWKKAVAEVTGEGPVNC